MGLMGTGTSLILIAAGAILAWAINYSVAGVDVTAVGVILMVVGAIGLLMSLLFWSSFAPFGSRASVGPDVIERETVVRDPHRHV